MNNECKSYPLSRQHKGLDYFDHDLGPNVSFPFDGIGGAGVTGGILAGRLE